MSAAKRMQAVYLDSGRVEVREAPVPDRPPGFALVRVECAGICNTDLELQRGYYGFSGIPGHEFVGEVVACDTRRLHGKRVVGEINLACGACEWCEDELGRHCPNRTVLGIVKHPGAFAEYLTLPERNLHVVDDAVGTDEATFAEPVAAASEILDQVGIPRGGKVAVLGDGKLGLLIAQVLQAEECAVHLYGHHEDKMRIAFSAGVRTFHASGELPRASYQWVVDATGSPAGLSQAVGMTRPRGTVVMKSTVASNVEIDMARVIVNEISLVGSRCGRFEPALELLVSGRLRLKEMVSARFPLAEAPRAFEHAARKGVLKVLLFPEM